MPADLDAQGVLPSARFVRSPNFDQRPPGEKVSLVVIHCISLPPGGFGGPEVEQLFTNRLDCSAHPYFAGLRDLRVSAHFFVRRDGELVQFVPTESRAWHAGQSSWKGRARCNDFSIGIELEGTDAEPYSDSQYAVAADLIGWLKRRYPIESIVGHSDIAPGRKTDPGPCFDWKRLGRLLAC